MYMRLCGTTCALAITFLVAYIYMAISADKGHMKQQFMATLLSDEQKTRYENIMKDVIFTSKDIL